MTRKDALLYTRIAGVEHMEILTGEKKERAIEILLKDRNQRRLGNPISNQNTSILFVADHEPNASIYDGGSQFNDDSWKKNK